MIIKVNFGNESSPLPSDEFILDYGRGYNASRGYGWITQASVDDASPIPIDISTNTRDRDLINEQSTDTLIHLQYPDGLTGARAAQTNQTPSAWEYDLENGTYQITVSVGDPEFTDSNHVINLERESVISGFVPTEDELFTEVTTTVEVTDGRLTLDAIGGENTKLNFIEIVPEDLIESEDSDSDIDEDTNPEAIIPDTTETEGEGNTETDTSTDSANTEGDGVEVDIDTPTDSADTEGDGAEVDTDATLDTTGTDGDDVVDGNEDIPTDSAETDSGDTDGGDDVEGDEGGDADTDTDTDTQTDSTDGDGDGEGGTTPDAVTPTEGDGDGDTSVDPNGTGSDTPGDTDASGDIGGEVGIPVEGGGVVEIVEPIGARINFNFGVPRADSPSGFTQDIGKAYDAERGYGWVTEDSAGSADFTPIDVVANGRDRDTLFNDGQGGQFREPVRDSLIHMQYPTGLPNSSQSVTTPAAWEYEIADGQYEVTVGVGDPTFFDSNHAINVEGESLISGFVPTGFDVNGSVPVDGQAFSQGSSTVEVTDGSLTVDAIGGENTKINFISIVPVDAS